MENPFSNYSKWSWFNDKAAVGENFNVDQPFFNELLSAAKKDGASVVRGQQDSYAYLAAGFLIILEKVGGSCTIKFKKPGY